MFIYKGPVKYVLLGELDISRDDDIASPLLFTVTQRFIHPTYSKKTRRNDIAVLVLNQTAKFDSFMSPACLHVCIIIAVKCIIYQEF